MLVWTVGTAPNPLLEDLPVSAMGAERCWYTAWLCKTGGSCLPTARFALREGYDAVAHNIHASVRGGRSLKPFRFESPATLSVVGHYATCAEIKGRRFSGLSAWLT